MSKKTKTLEVLPKTNLHTFNDEIFAGFKKLISSLNDGELNNDDTKKLFRHQRFLYEYMKAHNATPEKALNSRGLLLYHRLGSGKTISAIAIAEACRKYELDSKMADYPSRDYKRKVVIMLPASLKYDPWYKEFAEFCLSDCTLKNELQKTNSHKKAEKAFLVADYHFISYNAFASNAWVKQKNEIPTRKTKPGVYFNMMTNDDNPFDDSVVIIDEVHNLLNTISNEFKSNTYGFFVELYNQLLNAKNMKMIALSGTPIMNHPSELSYLFNILRGPVPGRPDIKFETDPDEFDNLFFTNNDSKIMLKNRQMYLRRINGLVSYYQGYRDDMFAKVIEDEVALPFSVEQADKYLMARNIEYLRTKDRLGKSNLEKEMKIMQSDLSIKCSNIVFPTYLWNKKELQKMNLRKRNGEAVKIDTVLKPYEYIDNTGKSNKVYGLIDPKKQSLEETQKIIFNILDNQSNPLNIKNELSNISIKMYHIMKRILESNGPVIVYSKYEGIYGVSMFAEVLKQNGFIDMQKHLNDMKGKKGEKKEKENENKDSHINLANVSNIVKSKKNQPGFMFWTGKSQNEKLKDVFNKKENKDGSLIKVFLVTEAGKEGISLKNIRQIHIMEPWWNDVITKQVIGRGVRITSHNDLKLSDFIDLRINESERTNGVKLVNVFKYHTYIDFRQDLYLDDKFEKMNEYEQRKTLYDIQTKMKKTSVNHITKEIAKEKLVKSELILSLLQQNAVDCQLNFNNNDYDCFTQDKIVEYFSTWNMNDDEMQRLNNFGIKLQVIIEDNIQYWLDTTNNDIYERKLDDVIGHAMNNFNKYYTKIGRLDVISGRIIFNKNYVKKLPIQIIQNNFYEHILEQPLLNKKVLEITNYDKTIYFSKLKPDKLISINITSLNDKMKKVKDIAESSINKYKAIDLEDPIDIFEYMEDIKDIEYVYIDFECLNGQMALINALLILILDRINKGAMNYVILGNYTGKYFDREKLVSNRGNIYEYNDSAYVNLITSNSEKFNSLLPPVYDTIAKNNKNISDKDFFARVFMTIQTLFDEGIIDKDKLEKVCENNILSELLVFLNQGEIDSFMSDFNIQKIKEDIDLYPGQDIEIQRIVYTIKNKMGENHPLYDDFDNQLVIELIQNNIETREKLIDEYSSDYNRRLRNLSIPQDIINTLMIYIEPMLLRVVDIKQTVEYQSLDIDKKYELRKSALVSKLIENFGI